MTNTDKYMQLISGILMHVKAVNLVNKRKFQSAIVHRQIDLVLSRVEVHFVMDFNI